MTEPKTLSHWLLRNNYIPAAGNWNNPQPDEQVYDAKADEFIPMTEARDRYLKNSTTFHK